MIHRSILLTGGALLVGAPAQREGTFGAQVTPRPGAMANAVIQLAETGNYERATCQPTQALGYRVYAPDDTAAMYIPFSRPQSVCAATALPSPQLQVMTVTAGSGNQN